MQKFPYILTQITAAQDHIQWLQLRRTNKNGFLNAMKFDSAALAGTRKDASLNSPHENKARNATRRSPRPLIIQDLFRHASKCPGQSR
jgi:hypothetical protein